MDLTALIAWSTNFWKIQIMPLGQKFEPMRTQFLELVQSQPYKLATIVAIMTGLLVLLIGLRMLRRTPYKQRRTKAPAVISAMPSYVAELDGPRSSHGDDMNDIAKRFAQNETAVETTDMSVDIPRVGDKNPKPPNQKTPEVQHQRMPKMSQTPTKNPMAQNETTKATPEQTKMTQSDAKKAAPQNNDLEQLVEAERKLHALHELYQAGLIAPEIYILKAREYAAIGK